MYWPTPSDYTEAIQNPTLCFGDSGLKSSTVVVDKLGIPKPISGNFAVVYQLVNGLEKHAVRCFQRNIPDQEKRYDGISKYLKNISLNYLTEFNFIRDGIRIKGKWYPILKMNWLEGETLYDYINNNINNQQTLFNIAEKFSKLINDLRNKNIAHGDLQHGNILIVNKEIKLIDYDGMFVPNLHNDISNEIGHPNYQHPSRNSKDFNVDIDNFSAWVIYTSLILIASEPMLWKKYSGADNLLFKKQDFDNPFASEKFLSLEKKNNPQILNILSYLKSFLLETNINKIPPLDISLLNNNFKNSFYNSGNNSPNVNIPAYTTAPTISNNGASWLNDHLKTTQEEQISVNDNSWLFDHINTQKPTAKFNSSYKLARFALLLVLLPDLLIFGINNNIKSIDFLIMLFSQVYLLTKYIHHQYSKTSEFINKKNLLIEIINVEKEIEKIRNEINAIISKKNLFLDEKGDKQSLLIKKIDDVKTQLINDIKNLELPIIDIDKKLSNLSTQKTQEIYNVENQMQIEMRDLVSKLSSQQTQENNELSSKLKDFQSSYFRNKYSSYTINQMPSYYIKTTLLQHGYCYLAEILNVKITSNKAYIITNNGSRYIPGIGPKRANEIMQWKNYVISEINNSIPKSLPIQEENSIRLKYNSIKNQLSNKIETIKNDIKNLRNITEKKYLDIQNDLNKIKTENINEFNKNKIKVENLKNQEMEVIKGEINKINSDIRIKMLELNTSLKKSNDLLNKYNWKLSKYNAELLAFKNITFKKYFEYCIFPFFK